MLESEVWMQDTMSRESDAGTKQVMCVPAFWVTEQSCFCTAGNPGAALSCCSQV